MEIYKLNDFAKWAKNEGIGDDTLRFVAGELSRGLLGDRLGGNIYKKRIGVGGRGKRGGGRVILVYREKDVILFVYGFLKKEQDNISESELAQLRIFGREFLTFTSVGRTSLERAGKLIAIQE